MDITEIRRTIQQALNYSTLSEREHHFVVIGLGIFHVNETKQDAELDVDVWLQTTEGKRIWITYKNIELALSELNQQPT